VKNWVSSDKTDSIRIFRKGMRQTDKWIEGWQGRGDKRQHPHSL